MAAHSLIRQAQRQGLGKTAASLPAPDALASFLLVRGGVEEGPVAGYVSGDFGTEAGDREGEVGTGKGEFSQVVCEDLDFRPAVVAVVKAFA
jgi:hypothetical protein